jgi:hypothetical protein
MNNIQKQKKKILRSRDLPERKAGNLTAICEPIVGSSTFQNPIGLHGLLLG